MAWYAVETPPKAFGSGLNPANTGAAKSRDTGTAKPSEIGHPRFMHLASIHKPRRV